MALKLKNPSTKYLAHRGREYNEHMLKEQSILALLKEQGCEEVEEEAETKPGKEAKQAEPK
jgi:hypothetical protein